MGRSESRHEERRIGSNEVDELWEEIEEAAAEWEQKLEEHRKRIEESYFRGLQRASLRERMKYDPSALRDAGEVSALGEQLAFLLLADYEAAKSAFDGAARKLLQETGGDFEGLLQAIERLTGDYSRLESPYQLIPALLTAYARRFTKPPKAKDEIAAKFLAELAQEARARGEGEWVDAGFLGGRPHDALPGETVEGYFERLGREVNNA